MSEAIGLAGNESMRFRAPDSPPRQPLYVGGTERWQVRLTHGALELTHARQPPRRFPLARIDRVICRRTLQWSGDALIACLQHGIPVLFEDGRGTTLGYALPAVAGDDALHGCLQRLAGSPEGRVSFDNWLRHRRREVLAAWWGDYFTRNPQSRGDLYAELKRRFVYRAEVHAVLAATLRPQFEAWVLSGLRAAGALPAYPAANGGALAVLDELTTLLWGQVNLESGALAVMAAEPRLQLTFLEGWFALHLEVLQWHLRALRRFLLEALQAWA